MSQQTIALRKFWGNEHDLKIFVGVMMEYNTFVDDQFWAFRIQSHSKDTVDQNQLFD